MVDFGALASGMDFGGLTGDAGGGFDVGIMENAFEGVTEDILDDGIALPEEIADDTFTENLLKQDEELNKAFESLDEDKQKEFNEQVLEIRDKWVQEGAKDVTGAEYAGDTLAAKIEEAKNAEEFDLGEVGFIDKEGNEIKDFDASKLTEEQIEQFKEDGYLEVDTNGDGVVDEKDQKVFVDLNGDGKISGKPDGDVNKDGFLNAEDIIKDFRSEEDLAKTTEELEKAGDNTKAKNKKTLGMKEIMSMIQQIAKLIPKQKPAPKTNNASNVTNPGYNPALAMERSIESTMAKTNYANLLIAQTKLEMSRGIPGRPSTGLSRTSLA